MSKHGGRTLGVDAENTSSDPHRTGAGIYSDTVSDILAVISSDFLSGILTGHSLWYFRKTLTWQVRNNSVVNPFDTSKWPKYHNLLWFRKFCPVSSLPLLLIYHITSHIAIMMILTKASLLLYIHEIHKNPYHYDLLAV